MFLARGLCYVISVESIPIRDPLFTAIAQGTVSLPGDTFVSPSVVVAVLVVLVGAYLLHATRFGRTVYAVGGNQQSAELMGLRVGRTKVAVYGISGLCSAIGGLLFAFYSLSGYSLSAVGTELDAIAATVIGGTLLSGGVGLVVGSVLGVLVLGPDPDLHLVRGHAQLVVDPDRDRGAAAGVRRAAAVPRAPSELSCYDMRHDRTRSSSPTISPLAASQASRSTGPTTTASRARARCRWRRCRGWRRSASGSPRSSPCSTATTPSPSRTSRCPRRPATSGSSRCSTRSPRSPGSPRWPGCRAARSPRTAARGPTTSAGCWSGRSRRSAEQGLTALVGYEMEFTVTDRGLRARAPRPRLQPARARAGRRVRRRRAARLRRQRPPARPAARRVRPGPDGAVARGRPTRSPRPTASSSPARPCAPPRTATACGCRSRPLPALDHGGQRLAHPLLRLARRGATCSRAGRAGRGRRTSPGSCATWPPSPPSPRPASARSPGCGRATSRARSRSGAWRTGRRRCATCPGSSLLGAGPRERRAEDVGRVGQPVPRAGRRARRGRRGDRRRAGAAPAGAGRPRHVDRRRARRARHRRAARQRRPSRRRRCATRASPTRSGPEVLGAFLAVRRSDATAATGMEIDDVLAGLRFRY